VNNVRIIAGMGAAFGLVALGLAYPTVLPTFAASIEEVQDQTGEAVWDVLTPKTSFDPSRLLKVSQKYDFKVDPRVVSSEPTQHSTVRKISYGRTEFVEVLQTSSGTYSSDALDSGNVEYPGILKERRSSPNVGLTYWSGGQWVVSKALNAGSFITITNYKDGQLLVTEDGTCVITRTSIQC
jgi:hypothetical protein